MKWKAIWLKTDFYERVERCAEHMGESTIGFIRTSIERRFATLPASVTAGYIQEDREDESGIRAKLSVVNSRIGDFERFIVVENLREAINEGLARLDQMQIE